jgi:uncharacterized membrane protein YGL010W
MKTADEWLREYAITHQNPLNRKIHKICVPLIFWSVFVLIWAIKWPSELAGPWLNWANLILAGVLAFYLSLGLRYFLWMMAVGALCVLSARWLDESGWPLPWIGGSVFILAWIGQFYGHKVEGRKPAFLQDLLFLLIGPLWVLNAATGKWPAKN